MTTLRVNGRPCHVDVPPGTSLLTALRDELHLTGARYGCGRGECGACVVLVDGEAVPSCTTTVDAATGHSVVTIEGLADGDALHPVQQAFLDEGALQCGYCTSGMILRAVSLLTRVPSPSEGEIREAMAPHLCRCAIYLRAIHAVQRAAERMAFTAAVP